MTQGLHADLSRRTFVKTAVAMGGSAAMAACMERESPSLPRGSPADRPGRQHAWNQTLRTDDHGNAVAPRHHVLLALTDPDGGTPTATERETVERALSTVDRAYPMGHDGDDGHRVGLLSTVGYSRAYFDRFDEGLPASVDLPPPEPLAPFEDPDPDEPDVAVHLASDYGSVVLGAEGALRGESDELNGVTVEATLTEVLSVADRRTGFVGAGLPAANQDVEGIPDSKPVDEDAPLYMGFKSGFTKNQATEDRVTIETGPFAEGATQHVSKLRLHLRQWYEQDSRFHREATMFCPVHADEDLIDGVGTNLGDSSKMTELACPAHTDDHAKEFGTVGHSQKTARARDDDGPIILRRDFDSTDDDQATLHFVALQERIADFVETREQMNGTDVAESGVVGQRSNNGILQYITVEQRGNFLIPPREHRALPTPIPGR